MHFLLGIDINFRRAAAAGSTFWRRRVRRLCSHRLINQPCVPDEGHWLLDTLTAVAGQAAYTGLSLHSSVEKKVAVA